jgi:hypothetical protein
MFGWRSSDGTLAPYTGQPLVTFSHHTTLRGTVTGINNIFVSTGRAQPRFTQQYDSTTRLRLESTYSERVTWAFAQPVVPLTVYLKVRPLYTQGTGGTGSPGNILFAIGNDPTVGGGRMTLARISGGTWSLSRVRQGSSSVNTSGADSGTWTYPYEVLASLNVNGSVTLTIRDGGGVQRHAGTSSANANVVIATDVWNGGQIHFGGVASGDTLGTWDYEAVKVARGVKTFDQILGIG